MIAFALVAALFAAQDSAMTQAEGHRASEAHGQDPAHFATARHAQHILSDFIADAQAGRVAYETMTPEMAAAARPQEAGMLQFIAQAGALQSIEHVGEQNGAHAFTVTFENGATSWRIAINAENKIAGLGVQPVQ